MKKFALPLFEVTLPSNQKKVKYRPFVVKERASLLMALQTDDPDAVLVAIAELFNVCTFGECVLSEMPIIDAEYLFIHIRNKSLGEDLDILHECECGQENEKRLSMDKVEVEGLGASVDIDMGDGLWLKMKFPTLTSSAVTSEDPSEEEVMSVIISCIDSSIMGDSVQSASDSTYEEMVEFVEGLTQIQLDKIEKFFDSLPKVVIKGEYTCKKCGKVNQVKIEGLQNFFG